MRLPGFTAEESLKRAAAGPRRAAERGRSTPPAGDGLVRPAGLGAYAGCVAVCRLTGMGWRDCAGGCLPFLALPY